MPILNIRDLEDGRFENEKDGNLDLAWLRTLAVMIFPSDEEARLKFINPITKNSELVCKKEIIEYLEKFKKPKAISEIEFKRVVKKAAKKHSPLLFGFLKIPGEKRFW